MLVSVKTAVERLSDDHSGHCGRHFAQVIKKIDHFYASTSQDLHQA